MRNLIKNKKGDVLTGNIIFIILNIAFLAILVLFLFSRMGGAAVLEEKYAKQIALILDSAEPGMIINLEMKDAIKIAKEEGRNLNDGVVIIQNNVVTVQLREKGGYSYSFFNDLNFDREESNYYLNENKTGYVFVIDR